MKLKTKMLLWIGAPLVVIFTAMAVFSYWEASDMIEKATEREMRALSEFHAEEVDRMVEGPKGLLEGIGRVWSTNIPTDERFLETAKDFTSRPDIDSIARQTAPSSTVRRVSYRLMSSTQRAVRGTNSQNPRRACSSTRSPRTNAPARRRLP